MTAKEAMEVRNNPSKKCDWKELQLCIAEALEKQIPKKPILKTTKSVSHVHYVNKPHEMKITETEAFHCPVCDWFVGEYFKPRNHAQQKKIYCDRCGTKMDWSDWTLEKEREGMQK